MLEATERQGSLWLIVMSIVSLAALGMACWTYRQERALQNELLVRPPIAVIPLSALLRKASESGDSRSVDQAAMRVKVAASRLRKQGYLVLDDGKLLAWPGQIEARPVTPETDANNPDGGNAQ